MAIINEDYVSFETAKLLKEKGFNEACNRVYQGPNLKYTTLPISPLMSIGELGGFHPKQLYVNNNELGDIVYTAPTQQTAMKWLREVHNIHISTTFGWVSGYNAQVDWAEESEKGNDKPACYIWRTDLNTTYEAAVEAAIKYCLENLI